MPYTTRSCGDLYLVGKEPACVPVGPWLDWAADLGVASYRNACLYQSIFDGPLEKRQIFLWSLPERKTVEQLTEEVQRDLSGFLPNYN